MDGIEDIVDETESDGLLALAASLRPPAPPSHRRRRFPIIIPIARADAEACGGVEIVHRTTAAVAAPHDPQLHAKAASVIAACSLKPRTPMESSLGGLLVAMLAASLDALSVARVAGFDSMLRVTLLSRSEKLAARAIELALVLDERRIPRRRKVTVEMDRIRHA
jgi:hypothetical protein